MSSRRRDFFTLACTQIDLSSGEMTKQAEQGNISSKHNSLFGEKP